MADVKNITEAAKNTELVIKLSKEYSFEWEKITEIDLSGLEDVTAKDMMRASKTLARTGGGTGDLVPEITLPYALTIAEQCTTYPIEFFERLNPKDAMKVRTTVVSFMFGEE